eukprot:14588870-Alexandrium_andersonii.AAC.1
MSSALGPASTFVGPTEAPGPASASSSLPSRLCPAAPLVLGLPAGRTAAVLPTPGVSTEARSLSAR